MAVEKLRLMSQGTFKLTVMVTGLALFQTLQSACVSNTDIPTLTE